MTHSSLSVVGFQKQFLTVSSLGIAASPASPSHENPGAPIAAVPNQHAFADASHGSPSATSIHTSFSRLLPAALERVWAAPHAAPASNYSACMALSTMIYLFSNHLYGPRKIMDKHKDFFASLDAIIDVVPERKLRDLLLCGLSSIRGAWEGMIIGAGLHKQHRFFKLLVDVGMRNSWGVVASELGHLHLLHAASMNLLDVLQRLLDAKCRPDGPLEPEKSYLLPGSYFRTSAITEALQSRNLQSAELLMSYCDIGRRFRVLSRSNTELLLYRLAGFDDWIRGRGLELFVESGLQLDDLVDWGPFKPWDTRPGRFGWVRTVYKNIHHPRHLQDENEYLLSTLDFLFYFHRPLFDKYAPRSAALATNITRAGVLRSLEGGTENFNEYLSTRAQRVDMPRLRWFLELVLAEQLAMRDMGGQARKPDIKAARALLCLDKDFGLSTMNKQVANFLMREVVLGVPECGLETGIEALELLLDVGASVDRETLQNAVMTVRDTRLLEFLAGRAAHVQTLRQDGVKALATALSLNDLGAARILIDYGVDVNSELSPEEYHDYRLPRHFDTVSVLAWAVDQHHRGMFLPRGDPTDMVRFMVGKGAHLRLSAKYPQPLHLLEFELCAQFTPVKTIQYIFNELDIRIPRDVPESSAYLLEACAIQLQDLEGDGGMLQVFQYLLSQGAKPLGPGSPLVAWIRMGGGAQVVLEMLAAGADINAYTSPATAYGRYSGMAQTALQAAAAICDPEMVTLLIKEGADVNAPARGDRGYTALEAACRERPGFDVPGSKERLETIQVLLDNGAEVNAAPAFERGRTALAEAAQSGSLEVAMLLLAHGADVNATPGRY